jgi:hypothetical protein
MIVLCNGMPRSASTWSFNVCRRLFQEVRPRDPLCARYHENVAEVIDPLCGAYSHVVLKCHTLDARGKELCACGQAFAIYTLRDPYDAIASAMTMFNHSFEDALGLIEHSMGLWAFHRGTGRAHIVNYDSIRDTPLEQVSAIATYLGLQASPQVLQPIARDTSMEAIRALACQVAPERGAIRTPRSMYDPQTHIHRNHIRDGRTGYGKQKLSEEQIRRVRETVEPFPERF